MEQRIELDSLFSTMKPDRGNLLRFFALINLGLIESLANGSMSATESVARFYFADNCLFVRKILKDKTADRVMSHGVQLPDLFDSLAVEEAQRAFLHELAIMRKLCLQLMDSQRQVA